MLEAMRKRLGLEESRLYNEIRFRGNTSSSSIPLALDSALRGPRAGARRIGLCAFGAGYTSAAAVLDCR
jgi:3-oxoacyl-[acyl-carrier-protein] synthase-3